MNDLAAFFLPIGFIGAAIAVLCALVAAVALARGAAGLTGGAVGLWIVGAMLSVTAGFSGNWLLLAISAGSLIAALVLGVVARSLLRLIPERPARAVVNEEPAPASVAVPVAVSRPRLAELRVGDALAKTGHA
ncbi:hypothetical protein [Microbacterium sp. CH12i]|uniref:hypothetical protein n=1 Tax=Microbacterium sp. CH12i TaxID=1479651 RepID=UPI000AB1762F|nr:hypothetical protein [Microbacterium sp. CH12i]